MRRQHKNKQGVNTQGVHTNLIQGRRVHVDRELCAHEQHVPVDIGGGHLNAREWCEENLFLVRELRGETNIGPTVDHCQF